MIRVFLIFITSFVITFTCLLYAEGAPPVPELNQLIKPPQVIKYQQKPHAVFDYGGLFFLFEVTKQPTAFPTCNAVQSTGKELRRFMVLRYQESLNDKAWQKYLIRK